MYKLMSKKSNSRNLNPVFNLSLQMHRRGGAILKNNSIDDCFSSDFISLHVANDEVEARKIAEHRADEGIAACHVIKRSELAKLVKEVNDRRKSGYYGNDKNKVIGPRSPNQYFSEVSVDIYETKYNNRGALKKTRLINRKFYYDAPFFGGKYVIHHFDGVEK